MPPSDAARKRRAIAARRRRYQTWFDGADSERRLRHVRATESDLWYRFQGFRKRQATYHTHAFHDVQQSLQRLGDGGKTAPDPAFKPISPNDRSIFISEWVRTRSDATVNRLTRSKHVVVPIESPLWEATAEDLEFMVKAGLGVLNMVDETSKKAWNGVTHDFMMKHCLIYTGKVIQRVQVRRNEKGYADFDVELLDPYYCAHDVGEKLRRFVYRSFYERNTIESVIEELGGTITEDISQLLGQKDGQQSRSLFALTEYWEEIAGENKGGKTMPIVYHGYFVSLATGDDMENGLPIYPKDILRRDRAWGRIPIVIQSQAANWRRFSGNRLQENSQSSGAGLGYGDSSNMQSTFIDHHAEPFYAVAIPLLVQLERLIGLEIDAHALNTLKPLFGQKEDQSQTKITDQGGLHPGGEVTGRTGDRLTPLDVTGQQFARSRPLEEIREQLEGIFPSILLSPQTFSGASGHYLNSQVDHAQNFLVPLVALSEQATAGMLNEIFYQMRRAPDLEAMVYGVNPSAESPNNRFSITFSGDKMPEGGEDLFDIEQPPEIPGDALQSAQLFDTLIKAEAMSKRSGMGRILHMQDPLSEEERIDAERVKLHPVMIDQGVLEGLQAAVEKAERSMKKTVDSGGGPEKVRNKRIAVRVAKRALAQAEARLLGSPNGGQGTPAAPNGFSPEVLPAEAQGYSPDQLAEAAGVQNAPTQGRPRPPGTP